MKKIFVDTSAWYAYSRSDDPFNHKVQDIMKNWEGRLVTTNFVFDEIITLARARLGNKAAFRIGEILRSLDVVEMVRVLPEDEEAAWNYLIKHSDKPYSYTDCTSFVVMNRLQLSNALSTDEDFRRAGFHVLP